MLSSWINQRSRWIKGYMQTWLVHMRSPITLYRRLGFVGFQMFVGFPPFTALINPLIWLLSAVALVIGPDHLSFLFPPAALIFALFALLIGNGMYIYFNIVAAAKRRWFDLVPWGLLAPAYWILHSVSAYKALWQLAVSPHYWEKTPARNLLQNAGGSGDGRLLLLLPGDRPVMPGADAAFLLGWFAATLIRRGWTALQTALAAGLIALNPVVLLMVTSKSAPLLAVLTARATVFSLDRIKAIGDTQATIVFGMAFACMFAVWPDALYFGAVLLIALPVANPEVRSLSSAFAAYFIACIPAIILLASFFLGAGWFGVSAAQLIRVWQAPLHGGATSAVAASAWLGRFGGQFWRPWGASVLLCWRSCRRCW